MGKIEYCETECGEILNNVHIFTCHILNSSNKCDINKILNGKIEEQTEMLRIWQTNQNKRSEYSPPDPV